MSDLLDYWDVLVVALIGGVILVPRPDRYRSVYRALGACMLAALSTAAGYVLLTRSGAVAAVVRLVGVEL